MSQQSSMNPVPQPPRWADAFLEWYCRPELLEEIQGDAWELFSIRADEQGIRRARMRYVWDVLRSFRLSTIKHLHLFGRPIMLKSHIKLALRQMQRQKMFSFIKIGGFAIGVAACLLISLYVRDELSYDQQVEENERVFRIVGVFEMEETLKGVHMAGPFAQAVRNDYPEIEQVGRILSTSLFDKAGDNQIRPASIQENSFERNMAYIDPEMVEILSFPMVYGTRAEALAKPNTLLISRRKAEKYFPGINPVGQVMIINDDKENPYVIGGVMENPSPHSHLDHEIYLTLSEKEFYPGEQTRWTAQNYPTYIKVQQGTDTEALAEKLKNIVVTYMLPIWEEAGLPDAEDRLGMIHFELQPVTDIHLYSQGIMDGMVHGDIRLVQLFGIITLVILLIACINFINLSTAQSANRAREVGLRKVIGSQKYQLISQFLVESAVYSLISFLLGLLLANLLIGPFNEMADTALSIPWGNGYFWGMLLMASLLIGLIAGIYPALFLSSFKPIQVLRGRLSKASRNAYLRNVLVIVQFATSIVLLISTAIIHKQVSFILNTQVGFDKEQVVLIEGTNTLGDQVSTFKEVLRALSMVEAVASSEYLPVDGGKRNGNTFTRVDSDLEQVPGQMWRVDHDYLQTLGIELIAGRNFDPARSTDSAQAAIINETLARKLMLEEPIGARINNGQDLVVIGVVKDFHFESLRGEINPLCMAVSYERTPNKLAVRLSTQDVDGTLKALNDSWKEFAPYQPLRYTFMDERFEEMYADVSRTRSIFTSFAVFAIIVACLGLFALSAFMAEQRSKEISIRKVLGASVNELFRLMTRSFIGLVGIAILIATPLGWYLMKSWLADFAYQTPIGWGVFVFASLVAVMIALLTISYHAFRTAVNNPATFLRNE